VFPVWSKEHPKALALAEVFSVARTMWMILRQPDSEEWDDIEHPNDLAIEWDNTEDIPMSWKATVERGVAVDPDERPDLALLGGIRAVASSLHMTRAV
jgi:hypothetical protein